MMTSCSNPICVKVLVSDVTIHKEGDKVSLVLADSSSDAWHFKYYAVITTRIVEIAT